MVALAHGKMLKTLFYLKVSMNSTMPLKCQAKTAMLGGVGDKDLFKAISAYMDQHRGKKSSM